MNTELQNLSRRIDQALGAKNLLLNSIQNLDHRINQTKREGWHIEAARDVIHAVAVKTQEEVQMCLESAVSHALRSVFDEPYKFHVDFEIKRQRTEANLTISKQGEKITPRDSSGGGVIDIISFTLKVLLWSLAPNHPAPVLLLDEPFRFVSTDLQPKVGELLREVQEQMGIQFVVITHEEELIEFADCVYKISNNKNVSRIKEI